MTKRTAAAAARSVKESEMAMAAAGATNEGQLGWVQDVKL
jgi:hypothetical protein